ncbi:MAG TPA: SMI1/KNR4 family protein [Rhizomicrobium sp.]|jgi:hypothetical protein|nr:SMI1/KNR4 family protein [Rhizomicrobium sp.]
MGKVEQAFSVLVAEGALPRRTLVGCSESQILAVEKEFGSALPREYRDFLAIAGRGAGKLFAGTDIFFPGVLALRSWAHELLQENSKEDVLPIDAVIFCMHQGYELNYFVPISDDPPVFQFVEGWDAAQQAWPSFSEFITSAIAAHRQQWPKLG